MSKRLKIIDYFDSLINEVDLKAEKLLKHLPTYEDQDHRNRIHYKRKLFIDEIEKIKNFNLTSTDEQNAVEDDEYIFKKYCFILDKRHMNVRLYIKQKWVSKYGIEEEFEDDNYLIVIDEKFGFLIVMEDGFVSEEKLNAFKELLTYQESIKYEYHDDDYEARLVLTFYSIDIFTETEANVQRRQLSLKESINVSFNAFNLANDFILCTNEEELFSVESLNLRTVFDSISPQAIRLFFRRPIKIRFSDIDIELLERDELVNFSKRLQSLLKISHFIFHINHRHYGFYLNDLEQFVLSNDIIYEFCLFGWIVSVEQQKNKPTLNVRRLDLVSPKLVKHNDDDDYEKLSFVQFESLRQLFLAGKRIDQIDAQTFTNLPNLDKLCFISREYGECTFGRVDLSLFQHLTNLRDLNFFRTGVTHVASLACLEHLQNLKIINFFDNEIKRVDEFPLMSLEEIYLSANLIDTIHPDAFFKLPKLVKLSLESNLLELIEPRWFRNKPHLKGIDLSNNKINIKIVHEHSFGPLNSLVVLKLNNSQIAQIKPYAFSGLSALEHLDLSDNRLAHLENFTFDGLCSVRVLNLKKMK